MQKARRHGSSPLRPLVSARFQVLFHSVIHGSFHLSFTVLVHYRSLSSIQPWQMVLPDSNRISPVPLYSGYCYVINHFIIRDYHPLRLTFPGYSNNSLQSFVAVLQPQLCRNIIGLGSSAFARHYLRNHYYFLLLWVLRCFSSPRSPHPKVVIHLQCTGLPHSDIYGSIRICQSPQLFAACHVLLRL